MQLLVLTNNPDRASFRQRVSVYRDILADRGVQTEVAGAPRGFFRASRLFRRARHFDAVFIHKKKFNLLDAFALRRHSRRIIYSFDDAVMLDHTRPESDSRAHYVPFRRIVRLADMVIAGSNYLAERARPFNANVHVLPIGLDTRDYGIEDAPPRDGSIRLVWVGSRSTLGYLRSIDPVLDRLAARFAHVTLRVIGDEFPRTGRMPVETIPWSPPGPPARSGYGRHRLGAAAGRSVHPGQVQLQGAGVFRFRAARCGLAGRHERRVCPGGERRDTWSRPSRIGWLG